MSTPIYVPATMATLIVVSAFFSATETALFSLEPLEVKRRTSGHGLVADALRWCLDHPRSILVTILLSNLAANTLYFTLAGYWAGSSGGVFATIIPIAALIVLVFMAEILPKSLALGMSGPWATWSAPILRAWALILTPVRLPLGGVLSFAANRVIASPATPRTLTEAELEEIVRHRPERFGLGRRTADVVGELVGLHEIQVREVMVPFVDLTPVEPHQPVSTALSVLLANGWRWLLVQHADGPPGYVDAKDLIIADRSSEVAEHVRPLEFIPEIARLPHLLEMFRSRHVERVLAVDEYGNEAGIVGREDVTESLVGGLVRSEHEEGALPVRLRPHRGWEVVGSLGVHEFEDLFSVRMPIHRNRTIGGLVVEQLGSLPAGGERVEVAGLTLEVLGVSRGRVMKVLVCFDREDVLPVDGAEAP